MSTQTQSSTSRTVAKTYTRAKFLDDVKRLDPCEACANFPV